ncbi:MAG TPA: hypothetical protein ENN36_05890 [Candidatus Bathyarchaeota archaeon]|nr:hypothetical protein [Candidatus Bathyarchaeota archaeon]
MSKKSIQAIFVVVMVLICSFAVGPPLFVSATENSNITVWYVTSNPDYTYDKAFIGWLDYMCSYQCQIRGYSTIPENANELENVQAIFIPSLRSNSLTNLQIDALKIYVQNGGNLFVGFEADKVTMRWFGTQSLGTDVPSSICYPENNVLDFNEILPENIDLILPKYQSGGYFTAEQLPSTIVPVLTKNDGTPLIFAGTEGEGKVVFLPNVWQWNYAGGYPTTHSPIILHLIKYLLPENNPRLLRSTEDIVCLRVDDILGWVDTNIETTISTFKNNGVTHVTLGVVPNYTPNSELKMLLSLLQGVELAMHGDSSGHSDIANYDYATAYSRFSEGISMMQNNYGLTPSVYLPPYERTANVEVLAALRDLNLVIGGGGDTNYYLNRIPDGPVDASFEGSLVASSESSYLKQCFFYECTRLLGNGPYVILTHPNTDCTYLAELIGWLKSRDVTFLTISEALNRCYGTLPLSNIYNTGDTGIASFSFNCDQYQAEVTIQTTRQGTAHIQYCDTIESANINGEAYTNFQENILTLPPLEDGNSYTIEVSFESITFTTQTQHVAKINMPTYIMDTVTVQNPNGQSEYTITDLQFTGDFSGNITSKIVPETVYVDGVASFQAIFFFVADVSGVHAINITYTFQTTFGIEQTQSNISVNILPFAFYWYSTKK